MKRQVFTATSATKSDAVVRDTTFKQGGLSSHHMCVHTLLLLLKTGASIYISLLLSIGTASLYFTALAPKFQYKSTKKQKKYDLS